jgi:hypothetical protein
MATVGTAYVIVRALLDKLRPDIEKGVTKAATAAKPAIEDVGRKVGAAIGDGAGPEMEKGVKKAVEGLAPALEPSVRRSGRGLGASLGRGLGDGVDGSPVRTALRRSMTRVLASIERSLAPDKNGRGAGERFMRGLLGGIDKIKLPPLFWLTALAVPALGGALKIIGAYLAATVSLAAAMGPAVAGAGLLAASGLFSLVSVMATVKLAFGGTKQEIAATAAEFKKAGAAFAPMRLAIQRALLPQLITALKTVGATAPIVTQGLTGVATKVGGVAVSIAQMVSNAANLGRLRSIFAANTVVTGNLLGALKPLVQILLVLLKAGAPLAVQFSGWAKGMLDAASAATLAGEASGRLAGFVGRAATVGAQLGRIAGGTLRGLAGIFRAAAPAGGVLLNNIERLTTKFATLANSASGQSSLRKFFDSALPVVAAFNGLIGDVFKILGQSISGNSGGLVAFIGSVRTDVLPALVSIGQALSSTGPALAQLTVAVAGVVDALSKSGALGAFTATLTTFLNVVSALLGLPFVGQFLAFAISLGAGAKALSLILGPFGGLKILAGPLGKAMQFLGTTVLPVVVRGLLGMSAALLANPIALIVLAVVALIAVLVIAYNKSTTFRNIVNSIGSAIKDGFLASVQFLKDVWDKAWPAIVSGAQAVGSAFTTAFDFVKSAFDTIAPIFLGIVNVISQPLQGVIQIVTGFVQLIIGLFTGDLSKITDGIANIIGGIVRLFFGLPARVLAALITFGPTIWNAITGAMTAANTFMLNGILAIAGVVAQGVILWVSFLASLPGRALSAISALPGLLTALGSRALTGLKNGAVAAYGAVGAFMSSLPGKLRSAVGNLGGILTSAGSALVDGLKNGITGALGRALSAAQDLANKIKNTVKSALGIASPSKVMHLIGVQTGKGLENGLRAAIPGVAGQAGALGSAATAQPGTSAFGAVPGQSAAAAAAAAVTQTGGTPSLAGLAQALAAALAEQPVSVLLDGVKVGEMVRRTVEDVNSRTARRVQTAGGL